MDDRIIRLVYKNYRGVTSSYTILPKSIRFGSSPWHPTEQWLLEVTDIERGAERTFALADISEWHAMGGDPMLILVDRASGDVAERHAMTCDACKGTCEGHVGGRHDVDTERRARVAAVALGWIEQGQIMICPRCHVKKS